MRTYKDDDSIRIFLLISFVFILYSFVLHPLGFLQAPSLALGDYFSESIRSQRPLPKEIKDMVIVVIDNQSLKQVGLQWPWKRSIFADVVNRISQGKPKAIFLDLAFQGKSNDEADDASLEDALKKAGNVVLPAYMNEDGEYVKPFEGIASWAAGVGVVNKKKDKDQITRSMQLVLLLNGKEEKLEYANELKILALAKNIPQTDIGYKAGKVIFSKELSIPVDTYGFIPINYSAGPSDFTNVAVSKILEKQEFDSSLFKDKIVMVGMSANIAHDIDQTPLGVIPGLGATPGIYTNANTLLMLMRANFIWALPVWGNLLILLIFSLGIGFLSLRLKANHATILAAGSIGSAVGIYLFLLAYYNFRMDIFSLIFMGIASYGIVEIYKYISLLIEAEKVKNLAIIDPQTQIFTQRYFRLMAQSALQNNSRKCAHFFCLIAINEFEKLNEKYAAVFYRLIKILSNMVREALGKKILIARYGEDAISLCAFSTRRKVLEEGFMRLFEEINTHEFIIKKDSLKVSVRVAAVDFPRENIKSYSDLITTAEAVLKRVPVQATPSLVIFDAKVDKVVIAGSAEEIVKATPKGELGYVSLDLAARTKELEAAFEELKKKEKEVAKTYFYTMHSLVKALEEKSPYTAGHSERVAYRSTALAIEMNLPKEEIEAIQRAAYLHDIGKIGLPDRILNKKERLSDEDFEYVKRHQADGAKILEGLPFSEEIIPLILYHHERYDGKGYPHGLSGDMIPRGAQIIAIADSFDAMTTGRGYNNPYVVLEEIVAELKKSAGQQFNPVYVNKFIELLQQKKIRAI